MARAPEDHFDEERREVESLLGQRIELAAAVTWICDDSDDSFVAQSREAIREDIGCNTFLGLSELAVSALPLENQVANNEQRPPVTERVKRIGDRAVRTVRNRRLPS